VDAVQKEKFQHRIMELKQGEDSIRKLIQNLDAKKDNALQTTFRMVSKHFSEVFKSIVTGGEGRLIMKTKEVQVRAGAVLVVAVLSRVAAVLSPLCSGVGSRDRMRLWLAGG
jgi:chromosome segregation ATPase